MKKLKIFTALFLCLLLMLTLFGCAENNAPAEATEGSDLESKEPVETVAPGKDPIEEYFDRCSALSLEAGKEIRVSSDIWQQEDVGDSQVKYTSLGGTVINTVLFDKEKERILSVSASLDINSYADEEMRANQIYNASVFAAAMSYGDIQTVNDICSDFESVIESGIEMYPENMKLSLSADETAVILIAESTVIYD